VNIETVVNSDDPVPLSVFDAASLEVAQLMERGPLPRFLALQAKSAAA